MSKYELDTDKLFARLDAKREWEGMAWRDVAAETGLSPSTLTRLGKGHNPDADGLVSLLMWLGLSFRQFTREAS